MLRVLHWGCLPTNEVQESPGSSLQERITRTGSNVTSTQATGACAISPKTKVVKTFGRSDFGLGKIYCDRGHCLTRHFLVTASGVPAERPRNHGSGNIGMSQDTH